MLLLDCEIMKRLAVSGYPPYDREQAEEVVDDLEVGVSVAWALMNVQAHLHRVLDP